MVNSGMLDTMKFETHDFASCFIWVCHKLWEEYRLEGAGEQDAEKFIWT